MIVAWNVDPAPLVKGDRYPDTSAAEPMVSNNYWLVVLRRTFFASSFWTNYYRRPDMFPIMSLQHQHLHRVATLIYRPSMRLNPLG